MTLASRIMCHLLSEMHSKLTVECFNQIKAKSRVHRAAKVEYKTLSQYILGWFASENTQG